MDLIMFQLFYERNSNRISYVLHLHDMNEGTPSNENLPQAKEMVGMRVAR